MTRPESSQPTLYVFLRGWASAADVATGSTLPETTAAALDGGGAGTEGDVARGASDAAPGRVAGGASPTMGSARVPAAGAFGFGGVRAGAGSAAVSGADRASGSGDVGGDVARTAGDGTTAGSVRVAVTGALAGGLGVVRALTGACGAAGGTDCASGVTTDARGASNPQAASTEIDAARAMPPPIATGRFHPVAEPFGSPQSPLSISCIQGRSSGSLASACGMMRSTEPRTALRRRSIVGGSVRCFSRTASRGAASNGGLPSN